MLKCSCSPTVDLRTRYTLSMPSKYTKDLLEPIIKSSYSKAEVLKKLGLKIAGGNYALIFETVKELKIDTSHFKGQGWSKSKVLPIKVPINDYFKRNTRYRHKVAKRYLIQSGVPYRCAICGIKDWQQQSLTLEIDHTDGDRMNNEINNLRFICPNCHSQTPTFRNKKRST